MKHLIFAAAALLALTAGAQAQTALQESLRFTLQGVAAGMRATG